MGASSHPKPGPRKSKQPGRKQAEPGPGSTEYPHHKPAKFPVNKIKNRIRDLERLLKRDSNKLSDERAEMYQRELKSCREELAHNAAQTAKGELARKYHMVRFFDRKKATRVLKRLKGELEAATAEDEEELRERVAEAELDLNYALYAPLAVPYPSLYPKNSVDSDEESKGNQSAARGDPRLKALVKKAMADNTLTELRETLYPDQLGLPSAASKYLTKRKQPDTHQNGVPRRKAPAPEEANTGFFE